MIFFKVESSTGTRVVVGFWVRKQSLEIAAP